MTELLDLIDLYRAHRDPGLRQKIENLAMQLFLDGEISMTQLDMITAG
jgi:hypothetical protein